MGILSFTNSSAVICSDFGKVDGSFNMLAGELYGKERMEGLKSRLRASPPGEVKPGREKHQMPPGQSNIAPVTAPASSGSSYYKSQSQVSPDLLLPKIPVHFSSFLSHCQVTTP
jgi:hypothetical protein